MDAINGRRVALPKYSSLEYTLHKIRRDISIHKPNMTLRRFEALFNLLIEKPKRIELNDIWSEFRAYDIILTYKYHILR